MRFARHKRPGLSNDTLGILHDHYKDTYSVIAARERLRDKLFLWVIVVFAVLGFEIQYPVNVHGTLGTLSLGGNNINLNSVPLAVLLAASWGFLAALVLKYCQTTKAVERSYPYLHLLEDEISIALGDVSLYRREGRAYLSNYPRLLEWAWRFYTIVFPVAMILAVIYLYGAEVAFLHRHILALVFDGVFAASIVVIVCVYRFLPGGKHDRLTPQTDE